MEKQQKSKAKKVWSAIGNVLIWIFVAFSVLMTILAFASQSNADGVPALGNNVILTVQTDSMSPTFLAGDIIIGKKLSDEEKTSLKVDDIITYITDLDGDGNRELNTHRIVEVVENETMGKSYLTKGDNPSATVDSGAVYPSDVRCIWQGTRLKGLGKVLDFLQSPNGFLITIVIPLVLFFALEIYLFIKKVKEVKGEGKKQITAADEELIKQRAIEEYIKQQAEAEAAKNSEGGEAAGDKPEKAEETEK